MKLCTRIAIATLATSPAIAQAPPSYSVQVLAPVHGVADVNNSGTVVGTAPLALAANRAWVAGPGVPLTWLPLPPGRMSSQALDVNEHGVVVGAVSSVAYADPTFGAIAAIWTPSPAGYQVQELSHLPGDIGSLATALNDTGDIVGFSQGGMYRRAAWFTAPGGIQDLSPTGAFDPKGINNARVVVCYSTACSRLDLDTMVLEVLPPPPGGFTNVLGGAINESGQIAGVMILATSTSCDRRSARYTDGVGWEVFGPCGQHNGPGGINSAGDMTMFYNLSPVVLFEDLGQFALEPLIQAPIGAWIPGTLAVGDLNDARQIAIYGLNPTTGQQGVLLLSPITYIGHSVCSGDGLAAPCPCGNESGIGHFEGCLNSSGRGARLLAEGSNSVADDDLSFVVSQAPAHQFALVFQGGIGQPVPVSNGLRCATTPLRRLEVVPLDGAGAGETQTSIVSGGAVLAGHSWLYQAWYRDPAGPCGGNANFTPALQITWQ